MGDRVEGDNEHTAPLTGLVVRAVLSGVGLVALLLLGHLFG